MTAEERRDRFLAAFDALAPEQQAALIAFMSLPKAARDARMNEIRALDTARGETHQTGDHQ